MTKLFNWNNRHKEKEKKRTLKSTIGNIAEGTGMGLNQKSVRKEIINETNSSQSVEGESEREKCN